MQTNMNEKRRVAIIGGGLVGSLNACFFAQRGWLVDVYEYRPDPRTQTHVPGRSINLAMSYRARQALQAVGLEETLVGKGIPMHGRYIHPVFGECVFAPYGTESHHYNLSVGRRILNEGMLEESEKHEGVQWHFDHKLLRLSKDGDVVFQVPNGQSTVSNADLILGCDGAYSAVRQSLLKQPGFDYSQSYIPHAYIELSIQPKDGQLRFLVKQPLFRLRKKVDNQINRLVPKLWVPLYTMVTYSRTPYSTVVKYRKRQDQILTGLMVMFIGIVAAMIFGVALTV